jgi:hypothetical protein
MNSLAPGDNVGSMIVDSQAAHESAPATNTLRP